MKEASFKSLHSYIVAIIIHHKSNIPEGILAVIFPSDVIISDNGDMLLNVSFHIQTLIEYFCMESKEFLKTGLKQENKGKTIKIRKNIK